MTWLNFIDRVIIPATIAVLLLGGIGGVALGCALVVRADAALRFMTKMNRWVSTRETFAALEHPLHLEPAPGPGGRRPFLGALLFIAGAATVYLILARLNFARGSYVPGVDVRRWILSGFALEATKWVLVAGSAFACVIGALMLVAPERLAAFERFVNQARSTEPLLAAGEKMRTPLEPLAAAHPRAAGWTIAGASLLVVLAMLELLISRIH